MEELKWGGMGVLHRWDGWMGGWVDDEKSLCPSFFPHLLMTWQWICGACLLLVSPHTWMFSAKSYPDFISPEVHPVFL